ncbi:MAG: hypothetical protein HY043_09410 [Verrucomicrobia bacterium]|nr:hypothetical protein [Verrucomicrobiota bacterium]
MIEWNIQSRAHACQACERHFRDQEAYHTLLFDEPAGFARMDVCESCWTSQYGLGASDRKGFISHWQGVYVPPPAAPPEPIARETAESLLRKLVTLGDPQYQAACFILAVMFERKRLLKVQSQANRNGQRVFIYEQPRTGDVFAIADPNLQLNQLEQVQRDVAQLLEHGLDSPANAAVADGAAAAATPPAAGATPGPEPAATTVPTK